MGGGGGGGGGRSGVPTEIKKNKKTIDIRLFFVLMLKIKFQVPGSSGSNGQVMGHNSVNVLRNSVKSHLNMDPKQSSEFQDPSSSNSLHIVLSMCFSFYKS